MKERPSRRTRVQPQWKVEPMTTGQNDELQRLAAALPTAETLKQLADLALTADELQQLPALKVIAKKRELALYGLDFEQYEARRSSWKELK